ncbi:hypothetical protein [Pseudomonas sp. IT-P176]|uniref:hypothetical protein n=1 Tax=Pseudomonas sp. IT-P176 TaxID=3026444 RepID=UPI0039E07353
MPLQYQPKEGSVLICDFRGYEVPEMIKVRPVVVIRKHRLDRIKSRDRKGKRVYGISQLETDEFNAIKVAVRRALGL